MFSYKSKIESYSYKVNLGTPVSFFCNLINDIGSNIINDYEISTVFKDELISEIGFRFNEDSTLNDLIPYIVDYYTSKFLENLDISGSNILFIYKPDRILFSYKSDIKAVKNVLYNLLLKENIFDKLIGNINHKTLRLSFEKLQSIKFTDLFNNVILVNNDKSIPAPYIPFKFFDNTLVKEEVIDEYDLNFNSSKIQKEIGLKLDTDNIISIIKEKAENDDLQAIAIRCNDVTFPLTSKDLKVFIKKEFEIEYCWLLFSEVFKENNEKNRKNIFHSELLKSFKKNVTDSDLSQLLSYLEKNHRLEGSLLTKYSKYSSYFEEVSKISNLDEMSNFEFYVSTIKGSTALGVYCKEKIGTKYNLLHWVKNNTDGTDLNYYKNLEPPKTKVDEKTFVFKPEIAFYYIKNYFEDFLESALNNCGKEYISNTLFFINNEPNPFIEVDFLVKENNKLCFIEAKTKLSNDNIEQTIKKYENFLAELDNIGINCNAEFYLISAFSDKSCENRQFFINQSKKKSYNKPRNDINTIPYYFDVPIPKFKNSKLTCIAEPDFKKLLSILKKI